MFTSKELDQIQSVIVQQSKSFLDSSSVDFTRLNDLILLLEKVDETRRKVWHQEKFGAYERLADTVFSSDDIPF